MSPIERDGDLQNSGIIKDTFVTTNLNFGSVILQITDAAVISSIDTSSWNNQIKEWPFLSFELYCTSRTTSEKTEPEIVFVEEAREKIFPWLFLPPCGNLNWHLAPILFLSDEKRVLDPWSLVWYMASFAGLVTFFLVVSCSECCCSKRAARTPPNTPPTSPVESTSEVSHWVEETPPPPYDLFAPPSYDTLHNGSAREYKNKCGAYVVPVHGQMVTLHNTTNSTPAEPR